MKVLACVVGLAAVSAQVDDFNLDVAQTGVAEADTDTFEFGNIFDSAEKPAENKDKRSAEEIAKYEASKAKIEKEQAEAKRKKAAEEEARRQYEYQ